MTDDFAQLTAATIEAIKLSDIPHAEKARLYLELLAVANSRRELEIPCELTKYGLNGTLGGACGGLVLIGLLAWFATYAPKDVIAGNHLCVIATTICVTVVVYGAYAFERSVRIAALWNKGLDAAVDKQISKRLAVPHHDSEH